MPEQDNKQIAVKVDHLTKTFKIPLEASTGIKQKLINTLKGRKGYREFTPLNNISFEIEKGDFFGIVGRNGSGKSTLLKTIAGIYSPNKGAVRVNGTLVPFIELGVGFNPELTGRENVFLNGALLGFSHQEMELMYDDIVEFAELEEFMEERLKNYSSGMQVRLAFSIAIRAQGDILLLDEVLAVGDEAFQKKCYDYFNLLKKQKKTVILVSHDMESVKRFCTKAAFIKNGHIDYIGNTTEVAKRYSEQNLLASIDKKDKKNSNDKTPSKKPIYDVNMKVTLRNNEKFIKQGEWVEFEVNLKLKNGKSKISDGEIGMSIYNSDGATIAILSNTRHHMAGVDLDNDRQNAKVVFRFEAIFPEGEYNTSFAYHNLKKRETYSRIDNENKFYIKSDEAAKHLLRTPNSIKYLS